MKKRAKHEVHPGIFDEPKPISCPRCDKPIVSIRTIRVSEHAKERHRLCSDCNLIVRFMESV